MTQPRTLLMIRHGEKPAGNDRGVDQHGNENPDGLIPRGWERAGALVTLFAPNGVTLRLASLHASLAQVSRRPGYQSN